MSRVPLREALLVLTGDGLLVHRPNQGFGVAERSRSELSQVYLMLSLPEEELTRTLEWPPDAELAELLGELRHLNGQMAALVDDVDWLDMVPLNHVFHHAIWQLSPLKLVIGEVDRVWALADAYIASGYSSRSARAHTVEEHDRIIAALASRGRAELTAALVADAGPGPPAGSRRRHGRAAAAGSRRARRRTGGDFAVARPARRAGRPAGDFDDLVADLTELTPGSH